MTLLLNHVVQAQCPGCKNTLRIPANWISEPMKCKHCGLVFQAKPPKQKGRFIQRAIRAATSMNIKLPKLRRKKKHKDKTPPPMVGKPFAPPPGVPVAQPALPAGQGAVPVAKPVGGMGMTPAPVAMAVGASHGAVPTAAPVGIAAGQKPPGFTRRRRGSWQKLAFIFIFFLGLGSLAAVVHHMNPDLFEFSNDVAQGTDKEGEQPATPTGKQETTKNGLLPPRTTAKTEPLFPIVTRQSTKAERTFRPIETRRTDRTDPTRPTQPTDPTTKTTQPTDTKPIVADAGKGFPRRMLAISINNYPYANPVAYGGDQGSGPRSFHQLMFQLAGMIHVPFDQVTSISDQGPVPLPGTKKLVELSIGQFLDTSRPMDRVVLVFVGHGVEIEGKAYLVPLLGEVDKSETLIPLDWLYARLASCPAQEKALVLDVCRFDRARGEERGKVERMTQGFEAILQKPPRGVSVLTACGADEYSWEMDYKKDPKNYVQGGVFLNMIGQIHEDGGLLDAKDEKPPDPLPLLDLQKALKRKTNSRVTAYLKEAQTPKLFGMGPDRVVGLDPKAPIPPKTVPKIDWIKDDFPGGIAKREDVNPLLYFPNLVPPIKQGDKTGMSADSLPPYAKDNLGAYKNDNKETEFRKAIKDSAETLRKYTSSFQETFPPMPENPQMANQLKANIERNQKNLATDVLAELQRQLVELESFAEDRAKENKLWQANFDYLRVRLLYRMAFIVEYSAMLGKIRKDELPPLVKGEHVGYKLASKVDLTEKTGREFIDQAKKILKKMADDHKGTPWELISKKEMITSLGLEWQPY